MQIMSEQALQNQSVFFKYAGIYNLGLIQESLSWKNFNQNDNGLIWNTMINNIIPDDIELTKIVAKSIAQLAPSSQSHFEIEDCRDKIMKCVLDLLKINDDDIIHSALEALVEIIRVNFFHMPQYLNSFLEVT